MSYLALDGHPVENAKEFNYRVATSKIGQESIIEFQRDGKQREASVRLVAAPETTDRAETLMEGKNPLHGHGGCQSFAGGGGRTWRAVKPQWRYCA